MMCWAPGPKGSVAPEERVPPACWGIGSGRPRAALTCHSVSPTRLTLGVCSQLGARTHRKTGLWYRGGCPRAVVEDGEPLTESPRVRAHAGHPSWGEGAAPQGGERSQPGVRERQGILGDRSRPEEALREEAPSRPFPSHGGSRCLPPAAWSWGGLGGTSRQHPSTGGRGPLGVSGSGPQGGHTSDITAVPASLESVKASNVHACPRSRCPGQKDGASSHCSFLQHSSGPRGKAMECGVWAPGPTQKPSRGQGAWGHVQAEGFSASSRPEGGEGGDADGTRGDVGSELVCFRHTVSGTGLCAGSHPLPEPPTGNLQHPLVPPSSVSLEPGRHPISGRSQPRAGSLQAALGCVSEPGCEVRSISLCLSHYLWSLCFFTCEMGLYKAQISLEWEDASASVWDHTSLLVPRTMGAR